MLRLSLHYHHSSVIKSQWWGSHSHHDRKNSSKALLICLLFPLTLDHTSQLLLIFHISLCNSSPALMAETEDQTRQQDPTWPELLGSDDWEGLLHPLNLNLRKLILRSGDFIQATYDSFNNDPNSRFCGSCRYGKKSLFHNFMFDRPDDYNQVKCPLVYVFKFPCIDSNIEASRRTNRNRDVDVRWV